MCNKRILFLDDDDTRTQGFLALNPEAVCVKTAGECIAYLKESWDEIYLDHDLGGEIFADSGREDTGMEVVRCIIRDLPSHLKNTLFIVHSMNVPAAVRMVEDLRSAGYTAARGILRFGL